MARIWDELPTTIRVRLAALGKLKVWWDNDNELQLEDAPITIEEGREELAKLQKMPPHHPKGEGMK